MEVPRYCFDMTEFWLNDEVMISPFASFAILFSTLGIWWIFEVIFGIYQKIKSITVIATLSINGVFLITLGVVYWSFWLTLQHHQGIIEETGLWFMRNTEFHLLSDRNKISFPDYIFQKSCETGEDIEINSEEEYLIWWQRYTEEIN